MSEGIVRRLQQRDDQAVEELINELYPQIYSYVYVRMRGHDAAKDITQEVFLRFLKGLDTFEFKGKTKNYLLRIAVNCCHSWYTSHTEVLLDEETAASYDPYVKEADMLRYYLSKLPKEQEEAVMLKYYMGCKGKEIALILEVSENTIKTRLRLGIKKLREMMKEDGL